MAEPNSLTAVEMGIDTHQEPVVFLRADSNICRSEGFKANTRIQVQWQDHSIIATLNVVTKAVLPLGKIGFSQIAWRRMGLSGEEQVTICHAPILHSMSAVRKKIYGHELTEQEINDIISDISTHRYSDMQIASFISACAGDRLNIAEITALTRAMVKSGKRLQWHQYTYLYDKHCIGGIPGNRTTPILVAICSAAGLTMPKTSSRAITSPSGTADTMEVLTTVRMSLAEMQETVRHANACLAWGGAINLSPADDLLIHIEHALDLDGEGQLVASVLSKKIAAGSTHALIDIPVGPTAKVRTQHQARHLINMFCKVAAALDLKVRCIITSGEQAIGNGIGPAQEARDILAVLQNHEDAPSDLRERAVFLSAQLMALARNHPHDDVSAYEVQARNILTSGQAWEQFQRICEAQGGLKTIPEARYQLPLCTDHSGTLLAMDNRRLARLAKLAGAPGSPSAGVRLHAKIGTALGEGQPLVTLYANSQGELSYAASYFDNNRDLFMIGEAP
ncbi:thymidine phosphorylase family protein [Aestuariicella hydrocarbonica]|uniref:Putative thymidine phosphorylase n=1 Tax=Pseudomaricurvus hydrocarbonicus TaxID=1470433 RepID=A0A9E5JWE4_9GAMM|nr:thymidine phosphorylase family protein [Aestuariicella hydrocarbonica]NHO65760.1 thymidine phosphorylase family protein [Aestuariicella hydrocarbonica]